MLLVCLIIYGMGSWYMTLVLRFDITPSSSRFSSQFAKQYHEATSLPSCYQMTLRLIGKWGERCFDVLQWKSAEHLHHDGYMYSSLHFWNSIYYLVYNIRYECDIKTKLKCKKRCLNVYTYICTFIYFYIFLLSRKRY